MITKQLLENNDDDCESVSSFNDNIYFLVLYRDKGIINSNVYGIITRYDEINDFTGKNKKFFKKHAQFKFKYSKIQFINPIYYRNKNIGHIHLETKNRIQYNSRKNDRMCIYKKGLPALVKISIRNNNDPENYLFQNGDYAWNAEQERFYQNYHLLHNVNGILSSKNLTIVNNQQDTFVEVLKLNKQMLAIGSLTPFTHIQSFILGCVLSLNI